jgi:hypothetical protein
MEAKKWARWLTFSLSVLRFYVVVIMPAYRTTALLLAIKVRPALPTAYRTTFLSFPHFLATRTTPILSPFLLLYILFLLLTPFQ